MLSTLPARPSARLPACSCVVRGPTECPRTVVGAEGGPCGRRRSCQAGLICCDSVLYLGGLTEEKVLVRAALRGCTARCKPTGRRSACLPGATPPPCLPTLAPTAPPPHPQMPTCQSPTLPGACPSRKRQEGPKSTVTASTQQTVAVVATAGLPRQQADAAGAGDGEVGGSWPES